MAAEDLQELRELVEFLKANGIAEFDMERADLKVRLKFAGLQPAAPRGLDLSHWRARLRRRARLRLPRGGSGDVAGSDACGGGSGG